MRSPASKGIGFEEMRERHPDRSFDRVFSQEDRVVFSWFLLFLPRLTDADAVTRLLLFVAGRFDSHTVLLFVV
jgi:hypothetical protein